ncbi:MAG: hypothetical protein ACR2RV_26385, partial [Verrucomicrobiales bacterium]
MKNAFAIASLLALAIPSQVLADLVFSADFEIDDSEAAVGELLVRNEPVLKVEPTSPVALAGACDLFVGARLPQLYQAYHLQ